MTDKELSDYIASSLSSSKSKEEIYSYLLSQGISIDRIQSHFNSSSVFESNEDAQKKTIRIVLIAAAILVGAGVFSFVASNWQEMTKLVKIGLIIFSLLICYSLGWYLKESEKLASTGEALIVLGAIIYGAGIFLVAQMFHVRADWPDGFILWMLGVVAIAYALETKWLFYLSILLGIIALIGYPFTFFSTTGFELFAFSSSFLLILATFVTLLTGYLIRAKMSRDLLSY